MRPGFPGRGAPAGVEDLWHLHQDAGIARWYGGTRTRCEGRERAAAMGEVWAAGGVHKRLAVLYVLRRPTVR
ncbi:hypothetical protein [Nocardiopsis sp. YSL2]|uniref:hypothetical protein n=1 Tax=Nocardiopsis sp. YSL2 TaxID=2939492 RepID=UPI0026F479D9|nr:hypothetical protein [Nocardiopsis sp. YSL2]